MNEINKSFFEICLKLLLNCSDDISIIQTVKDINEGIFYLNSIPWSNNTLFQLKKHEVLNYIAKVRVGNIIDAFIDEKCIFAIDWKLSKTPITYLDANGIYFNLQIETYRLILKGMYYFLRNKNTTFADKKIISDLLQQNIDVIQKFYLS